MYIGIGLAILSGVFLGTCFLPMRYMQKFAWENTWFVWSLVGLLILPPLIAYLTIPSLGQVMSEVGLRLNLIILGVGLVAGTSGIFFGLGLSKVGMTLANSLSNGVSLAVGSFIPLVIQHREALSGKLGATLLVGLFLSLLGVLICSKAGAQRNQESPYAQVESPGPKTKVLKHVLQGIVLSIAAGLLTPLQNLGIAFADDYMKVARSHGASEAFMTFAFYIPYLGTAFISNGIYCAYLWKRNHSIREFSEPNGVKFTLMATSMAVLWMVGMLLYGWAIPWMASYGPVIGWPVSLASTSISAAIVEYYYGDWQGQALRTLSYGLVVLLLSITTFALANYLI